MRTDDAPALEADAVWVAALFAVDPAGLGGVVLRAPAGAARDAWTALTQALLPAATPWRRVPQHSSDAALLGGLDLGATLQAGRPVAQQGLLALADGGVIVLTMAERLAAGRTAQLAAVLDTGELAAEREAPALRRPARLGVLALDEGLGDEERAPAALLDRLAFHLELAAQVGQAPWSADEIVRARALLSQVHCPEDILQALCAAAQSLGVHSLRAPLLAVRAARAAAALDSVLEVQEQHAALAARLVLGPRATQVPAAAAPTEEDAAQDQPAEPPEPAPDTQTAGASEPPDDRPSEAPEDGKHDEDDGDTEAPNADTAQAMADMVLAAAQAAIPSGLLASLKLGASNQARAAAGRSGASQKGRSRGRPIGARRGEPRGGARLNVIETLRAAAPWQRLRQAEAARTQAAAPAGPPRVLVRRQDFHVTRVRQLGQTTTVFVVDASGSAALNRLSEAKGAVELLLADCYVRRDHVAVLAFRGSGAELLLPPTRSLARAKRSLAALPGGGGTPLAAGIAAACQLADTVRRRGETPIVVLLTDGRGNIARDGTPGRARATEDAHAAARQLRLGGFTALLLDTSPQPQASARTLAQAMGAVYLPLPYAGAQLLSQAVRAATVSAAR
jgi:magnesium chelatase subunit D